MRDKRSSFDRCAILMVLGGLPVWVAAIDCNCCRLDWGDGDCSADGGGGGGGGGVG